MIELGLAFSSFFETLFRRLEEIIVNPEPSAVARLTITTVSRESFSFRWEWLTRLD